MVIFWPMAMICQFAKSVKIWQDLSKNFKFFYKFLKMIIFGQKLALQSAHFRVHKRSRLFIKSSTVWGLAYFVGAAKLKTRTVDDLRHSFCRAAASKSSTVQVFLVVFGSFLVKTAYCCGARSAHLPQRVFGHFWPKLVKNSLC